MASLEHDMLVKIGADIKGLKRNLKKGEKNVDDFSNKSVKSVNRLNKSFISLKRVVGAAVVIAMVKATSATAEVIMRFEKLEASMITVTGSTVKAAAAFEELQEFTAKTPFQLDEMVASFIKLKSMGLDPSKEALLSYANTASAMGKTLNQVIEAVADAATGEFERLKEFGIRAKSQGDHVTFLFQGMSTTVKKNSKEITEYIRSIGDVQFAGAVERQANTLSTSVSNLSDSWDKLLKAIGDVGVTAVFKGAVDMLRDMVDAMKVITTWDVQEGSIADQLGIMTKKERDQLALREELYAEHAKVMSEAQEKINKMLSGEGGGDTFAPDLGMEFEDIQNSPEIISMKEKLAEKIRLLNEGLMSEQELETMHHQTSLEILKEALENEVITRVEYNKIKEGLEKAHMETLSKIKKKALTDEEKWDKSSAKDKVITVSKKMRDIIGVTASSNKVLFNINKAAALAEAILSAKQTIVDAYKWGNARGGPVLGAVMGGVAAAAQAANIAQIASSSYGGGAGGVSGGGGGGTVSVRPVDEFGRPEEAQEAQAQKVVNITVRGQSAIGPETLKEIFDGLNEGLDDNFKLNLSVG